MAHNTLLLKVDNLDVSRMYKTMTRYYQDAGLDLYSPRIITVAPGQLGATIDFEICCKMIDSEGKDIGYRLVPRSSISKTPLRMSNSEGIIDAGYRGHIMAKVDNLSPITGRPVKYVIGKGQRLFQIVAADLIPFDIKLVSELDETDRGSGGFGSTG